MSEVGYERRGAAAWVVLNRPDDLNAIDGSVVTGLATALATARDDAEVRAVVLTGTGRAFCAGGDLKAVREMAETDPRGGQGFLLDLGAVLSTLERLPKPTIAAVNGLALAGGLEIVLCCDLVYAAQSARFGDAHANYGLIPGGGGSIRLPRKVGPALANYLFYTGRMLPGAELVTAGLVNAVVPDGDLESTVDDVVESIAAKSPLGLARTKQLVHDGLQQPIETGLRLELLASDAHARSHDMAEGLAAFGEKRAPRFLGR